MDVAHLCDSWKNGTEKDSYKTGPGERFDGWRAMCASARNILQHSSGRRLPMGIQRCAPGACRFELRLDAN